MFFFIFFANVESPYLMLQESLSEERCYLLNCPILPLTECVHNGECMTLCDGELGDAKETS